MLLQEGEILKHDNNRYQIQAQIGSESTFGAVFKALDNDGAPVVVKQLLGATQFAADTGMDYDYTRTTFQREADILMRHSNPQIVRGLDFFERDEDLFLVMEFINGEDLDQVLIQKLEEENGQPFSESEVLAIGTDLCHVIHNIHQLPGQVLYRDLKPRNIMWDAQERCIKIIDFGTARFMDKSQHSTQALGTPGYAPPEFYSTDKPLTFASDVYTIGATLYELLTGVVPEAHMVPDNFQGLDSQISDKLKAIIRKSMAQEPGRRYQTAEDMGKALATLGGPDQTQIATKARNPYPYLSCLCVSCGAQPTNDKSVFCAQCGGKIHVAMLRIMPADNHPSMDLFLDKSDNLIGRLDMEEEIFPDIDLSRYDPDCYVSRKHCVLRRQETQFYIEALQTTNATEVDNYALTPGRSVPISSGSEILLANLKVHFITRPCMDKG